MNDDRNQYNENENLGDDSQNRDNGLENGETSRNDFSGNNGTYNPRGNYDEGQVFKNNSFDENRNYSTINDEDVKQIVREEVYKSKPKNMWVKFISIAIIFSLLGSGVTGIVMGKVFGGNTNTGTTGKTTSQTINVKDESNIENAVATKAIPSVVGITTATEINTGNSFFGNQEQYVEGVGSGVIITEDGYILTNSHVVSDGEASDINVILSGGEKIAAKLIWNDANMDLAVVKIEQTGLTPIEIGDSKEVTIGDKAIAIGNPLGLDLQSTLTSGIISGLNRTITLENNSSMDGLLQTDASINSGNSGGALLNSTGQLIGVNTAKASQGEGIGFAIPINTAKPIIDKIVKTGSFETVSLGVQGTDLEMYENNFNIDTGAKEGAAIMQVDESSPAGKAGLKQGDVVTKLGDTKVKDMSSLRSALLNYSFGDKAKMTVVRNGKDVELEVTFEKYEAKQSSNTQKQEQQQQQNQNNQQEENQGGLFNLFGN